MNRSMIAVPALILLAATAACAGEDTPPAEGGGGRKVADAQVVELVPDAVAGEKLGTVSDTPVDQGVLAGWWAADLAGGSPEEPRNPAEVQLPEAREGMGYVAFTGSSGCRSPESAELWQSGDDLYPVFTGGEDHETCVREFTPYVQFAVPADAIATARTVQGAEPVSASGPGKPAHFVALGPLGTDTDGLREPVTLGTDGEGDELYGRLEDAGAAKLDEARDALTGEPADDGSRRYAFVLPGCVATGAVLVVAPTVMSAELTGGDDTFCESAAYFLAVFEIAGQDVPEGADVAVYGVQ